MLFFEINCETVFSLSVPNSYAEGGGGGKVGV